MSYKFRILAEIGWAIVVGMGIAIAQAAADFDESVFAGDPGAWFAMLAGMLIRAAGGAALAAAAGKFIVKGPDPAP